MKRYEYKIIDVPVAETKRRWFKRSGATQVEINVQMMNEHGQAGWDYVRREILTSSAGGFFRKKSPVASEVMVFRRPLNSVDAPEELAQQLRAEPVHVAPRRMTSSDLIEQVRSGETKFKAQTPRPTFPNLAAAS